jgi:hypothetical protein
MLSGRLPGCRRVLLLIVVGFAPAAWRKSGSWRAHA